ncbi:unnamed protein product [Durusdinium trenchii]|uniref:Uncharacterized protein n=1 Tax=Durusdinium trenchii TaxID=1381693 RepID=A0ABP0I7L1_9DINO
MLRAMRAPHGALRKAPVSTGSALLSTGPSARCSRFLATKKEEKKVPPETPEEVTRKLREQRDYWDKQERSTVKTILSQWGGLLFFGFWCLVAWLGKQWAEYEMRLVEREEAEKTRRRKRKVPEE